MAELPPLPDRCAALEATDEEALTETRDAWRAAYELRDRPATPALDHELARRAEDWLGEFNLPERATMLG